MKRFLIILLGYYVASVAAAATGTILRGIRAAINESANDAASWFVLVAASPITAVIAGAIGLIPGVLIIGLLELLSARRWYYYCLGGGFSGWIMSVGRGPMLPLLPPPVPTVLDNLTFVIFISGLVGGLAYWAVAGRRAIGIYVDD